MDGAVVDVDDELAILPVRVFVSADQKLQSEIVRGCDRRRHAAATDVDDRHAGGHVANEFAESGWT
jgi:hypothetical protein